MWEIYHLNGRRIVLETFFYKIRTNVKMHNKLQGENLLKKILALFFAKTVLYTSLVYQKVRKAGKVWNFWDSREHDCNKSQKVDNNNTIIKSGGCKIRLYILTNMRWVHFSQNSFKQFWWMHTSWEKIPVHILEVSISSLIWYKFDRGIFFQRY